MQESPEILFTSDLRAPHATLDELHELVVVHLAEVRVPVNTVLLRCADDTVRDLRADIPDALDARIHKLESVLLWCKRVGEGERCGFDHAIGDGGRAREDGTETEAGEDVHVVTLAWVVLLAIVRERGEGRAGCEDNASLRPLDSLVELAFGKAHGVG